MELDICWDLREFSMTHVDVLFGGVPNFGAISCHRLDKVTNVLTLW